jgi:hypothetical protein
MRMSDALVPEGSLACLTEPMKIGAVLVCIDVEMGKRYKGLKIFTTADQKWAAFFIAHFCESDRRCRKIEDLKLVIGRESLVVSIMGCITVAAKSAERKNLMPMSGNAVK